MHKNQFNARTSEKEKFLLNENWQQLKLGDTVLIKDELRKSKEVPEN